MKYATADREYQYFIFRSWIFFGSLYSKFMRISKLFGGYGSINFSSFPIVVLQTKKYFLNLFYNKHIQDKSLKRKSNQTRYLTGNESYSNIFCWNTSTVIHFVRNRPEITASTWDENNGIYFRTDQQNPLIRTVTISYDILERTIQQRCVLSYWSRSILLESWFRFQVMGTTCWVARTTPGNKDHYPVSTVFISELSLGATCYCGYINI